METIKNKAATSIINCVALSALIFLSACASTSRPSLIREGDHRAKLIEEARISYPLEARQLGREGWVTLNYVIDVNGNVVDPVVEDYRGPKELVEATKRLLLRRQYLPATKGGTAYVQANNSLHLDFFFLGEKGASKDFIARAKRIINRSDKEETFDLKRELECLNKLVRNLYEEAWYQWLLAQYHIENKDHAQAVTALKRAMMFDDKYLDSKLYAIAIEQYHHEKVQVIKKQDGFSYIRHEYPSTMPSIQRRQLPQESKIFAASLVENETWFRKVEGESFLVEKGEGEIENIDLRCSKGRFRFNVPMKEAFDIQKLGQCKVFIEGRDNTQVKLVIHNPIPYRL